MRGRPRSPRSGRPIGVTASVTSKAATRKRQSPVRSINADQHVESTVSAKIDFNFASFYEVNPTVTFESQNQSVYGSIGKTLAGELLVDDTASDDACGRGRSE